MKNMFKKLDTKGVSKNLDSKIGDNTMYCFYKKAKIEVVAKEINEKEGIIYFIFEGIRFNELTEIKEIISYIFIDENYNHYEKLIKYMMMDLNIIYTDTLRYIKEFEYKNYLELIKR